MLSFFLSFFLSCLFVCLFSRAVSVPDLLWAELLVPEPGDGSVLHVPSPAGHYGVGAQPHDQGMHFM